MLPQKQAKEAIVPNISETEHEDIGRRENVVAKAGVPKDDKNWPPFFPIIHHFIAIEILVPAQRLQYHDARELFVGVVHGKGLHEFFRWFEKIEPVYGLVCKENCDSAFGWRNIDEEGNVGEFTEKVKVKKFFAHYMFDIVPLKVVFEPFDRGRDYLVDLFTGVGEEIETVAMPATNFEDTAPNEQHACRVGNSRRDEKCTPAFGLMKSDKKARMVDRVEKFKSKKFFVPYLFDILPLEGVFGWYGMKLLQLWKLIEEQILWPFDREKEEEIISPHKQFFPSPITWDEFFWALGILRSRIFSRMCGQNLVLIPLADLINHSPSITTEDHAWEIRGAAGLFSWDSLFSLRTPVSVKADEQVLIQYDINKSNESVCLLVVCLLVVEWQESLSKSGDKLGEGEITAPHLFEILPLMGVWEWYLTVPTPYIFLVHYIKLSGSLHQAPSALDQDDANYSSLDEESGEIVPFGSATVCPLFPCIAMGSLPKELLSLHEKYSSL